MQDVTQPQADAIPTGGNQSCIVSEAANHVLEESDFSAAWYVDTNLTRHRISTPAMYNCLVRVRQIPVRRIDVTTEQLERFHAVSGAECNALLVQVGVSTWYINGTNERYFVPDHVFDCIADRGVPVKRDPDLTLIGLFPDRGHTAYCGIMP